jgi:DNA-binding NarL/FixJ family response regulator
VDKKADNKDAWLENGPQNCTNSSHRVGFTVHVEMKPVELCCFFCGVHPLSPRPTYPDGLTAREVVVLRHQALGMTDAQVAGQLVLSPRTVQGHLRSIYNKLNVTSRSAATRYAVEHKLV